MTIAYILGHFPSYSEQFIVKELIELEKKGTRVVVFSLRKGKAGAGRQSSLKVRVYYNSSFFSVKKIAAHIYMLYALKWTYFRVLRQSMHTENTTLLFLLKQIRNFSTGIYFLFLLRKITVDQIHAHFISLPASIAMIVSELSGIPFSCTAHASDIYTTSRKELIEKLHNAKFTITCTKTNKHFLDGLLSKPGPGKVIHVYHGIDIPQWPVKTAGFNSEPPIQILSVCRLVEKKGIIYLLHAVKHLKDRGFSIRCSIVGDGPLGSSFKSYVQKNGLTDAVKFYGAVSQEHVKSFYSNADIFILPCIISANKDRDGLPNVLLEALATGVPVISTSVSAVPELIIHEHTGLLVQQRDFRSIAEAIIRLKTDSVLYKHIAENGLKKIKEFDIKLSTDQLYELFGNYEERQFQN